MEPPPAVDLRLAALSMAAQPIEYGTPGSERVGRAKPPPAVPLCLAPFPGAANPVVSIAVQIDLSQTARTAARQARFTGGMSKLFPPNNKNNSESANPCCPVGPSF
ncbi:hypothetical protein GCM10011348_32400 [Marinobacterium nitratireducens]|uniref:Uncharacterized protein n=1 Tax=Marinobacterium nitratireducens TaxID=518897 RepID=A0A918DVV9_9GAMM|nr:hypothetical protein GCM10011348_32400 [Marinobacterium nitratireducens]